SYTSSASYGALSARCNGTNGVYTAQQPATTAYSGTHQNIGLKTPSPSPTSLNGAPQSNGLLEETTDHSGFANPEHNAQQYDPVNGSYNNAMNQHQQYMDSQHSQLPGGQAYHPQVSSAGTIPSYGQYQQQLPVMHPGSNSYAQSPAGYNHYGYSGVASPHSGQSVSASMNSQMNPNIPPSKTILAPSLLVRPKAKILPAMPSSGHPQHPYIGGPGGPAQAYQPQMMDTSGQQAPPGMKPRVTATLWEDEDNHMINGTKLLNVAGMTRGRRDGILKSEKTRHVVKIGPMHLKGVWIPFDRALDFANKEKITEALYPLFVHNIGALLYHPTNATRTSAVMAAADRRRVDNPKSGPGGTPGAPGTQTPSLHHHHSMASSHVSQSPHSIAPHPGSGRPALDRAHTFPTPPTSASSGIGMSNQSNAYGWDAQSMSNAGQNPQSIVDSHPHSTPNTPATTPPGHAMSNLQSYQPQPPYDAVKSMYSTSGTSQGQYTPQQSMQSNGMGRYAPVQPSNYMKHEMGPPTSRITEIEEHDSKADVYPHGQGTSSVGHATGEEEADHEHDSDYPNDSSNNAYATNRAAYSYNAGSNLASLQGDHAHLSPEMTGSPSHQNGSGRVTPRTAAGGQAQWTAGQQTPPRAAYSSSVYNPISDARGTLPNGTSSVDAYGSGSMQSAYAPAHMNGATASNKRMREDEDADYGSRPASRGDDIDGMKRRKFGTEGVGGGNSLDRNRTANRPIVQPARI
ncbi:MAG: hypothetical protein Q9184_006219, partial [Pyrenodesmia sp. 2 TL-2023]